MRVMSFRWRGKEGYGILADDGVIDVSSAFADRYPSLRAAIEADAMAEIKAWAAGREADIALADVTYLPVIPDARKVLCIGINYLKTHPVDGEVKRPDFPTCFIKAPGALIGHEEALIKPKATECYDYEGELAFVIGRAGRHIRPEEALGHIAGYTCLNDGSARDWQKHSVTAGKNFAAASSCGPWMVTADEIPDPAALTLTTRINGVEVQSSGTDLMMFDIPTIIAYLSTITPLSPGDIISTGSPEGSGAKQDPPRFLGAGDVIEVELSAIGCLRNTVADEE